MCRPSVTITLRESTCTAGFRRAKNAATITLEIRSPYDEIASVARAVNSPITRGPSPAPPVREMRLNLSVHAQPRRSPVKRPQRRQRFQRLSAARTAADPMASSLFVVSHCETTTPMPSEPRPHNPGHPPDRRRRLDGGTAEFHHDHGTSPVGWRALQLAASA